MGERERFPYSVNQFFTVKMRVFKQTNKQKNNNTFL